MWANRGKPLVFADMINVLNQPLASGSRWLGSEHLVPLVLATVAMLPYLQTTQFLWVNLDDPQFFGPGAIASSPVTGDALMRSLTHVGVLNLWHPVTNWSHQIDTILVGSAGWGWRHFVNTVLHGVVAAILYGVVRGLGVSRVSSVAGVLLFALHPQRVEAVAWLTARKELLGAIGFLLAVGFWVHWRRLGVGWALAASYVSALVAVASHPGTVVLPGVLWAVDTFVLSPQSGARPRWWPSPALIPPLLMGLAVAAMTYLMHQHGGHGEVEAGQGIVDRLSRGLLGLWFYVANTVWPWPSRLFSIPPESLMVSQVMAIGSLAVLGGGIWLWGKLEESRCGVIRCGLAWAGFALLPVVGVVAAGPYLGADRHAYLAQAGIALSLAAGIDLVSGPLRKGLLVLAFGTSVIFAGLSTVRCADWRDSFSLFAAEMRRSPQSKIAPLHLGAAWLDAGHPREALVFFEKSLEIDPHFELALRNAAKARAQLDSQGVENLP